MKHKNIYDMKLEIAPFEKMKSREKTVEVRLNDKKRRRVKSGDYIRFTCMRTGEVITARVVSKNVFKDFLSLFQSDLFGKCGFSGETPEKAVKDMYKYYTPEDEKKYGVVGIEIVVVLDIYSKGAYPANVLSNFYPNGFEIDGVHCASMEGFLQSLKYKDIAEQMAVCGLCGKEAKQSGKHKFFWKISGNVYWKGKKIKRCGAEFDALLQRAYRALASNPVFYNALNASKGFELTHVIGKKCKRTTILTEREFIGVLNALRDEIKI